MSDALLARITEEALERYYLAMEQEEERRLAAFNAAVRHDGVRAWVVGPPLPIGNGTPRSVLAEVKGTTARSHDRAECDELLAWVAAVYDLPFVRHAEIQDTEREGDAR